MKSCSSFSEGMKLWSSTMWRMKNFARWITEVCAAHVSGIDFCCILMCSVWFCLIVFVWVSTYLGPSCFLRWKRIARTHCDDIDVDSRSWLSSSMPTIMLRGKRQEKLLHIKQDLCTKTPAQKKSLWFLKVPVNYLIVAWESMLECLDLQAHCLFCPLCDHWTMCTTYFRKPWMKILNPLNLHDDQSKILYLYMLINWTKWLKSCTMLGEASLMGAKMRKDSLRIGGSILTMVNLSMETTTAVIIDNFLPAEESNGN